MIAPDILDGLDVYMVGGAVRDQLLGLPVNDRDWVVVGATPDDLESRGFKSIGLEFPVFLHPHTREEYALARTERKTGPGYKGFEFSTSSRVSLDQDLRRRDLTINAMALSPEGTLIDPFGGRQDLDDRVLRHVSAAFMEDPVRLLRVARFRTRFGFSIAAETWALMRSMVENGEVDALVPERVWMELHGALTEPKPATFFNTLRGCGALERVVPEIDALFGVPQNVHYHPEIDTGVHTMMVLDMASALSADPVVRFAALVHDLGKALTPQDEWPSHHDHEQSGLACIRDLCKRLRIPNQYRDLALLGCKVHLKLHRVDDMKPAAILGLLETIDAFRRPLRLEQVLLVGEADLRGRKGSEDRPYAQARTLRDCFQAARQVDTAAIAGGQRSGPDVAQRIRQQRCDAIRSIRKSAGSAPVPDY